MNLATTMSLEFLPNISIYLGVAIQAFCAILLGGLVGYDREKKLKSAGIKTNILICLGATLYTNIGILVAAGFADDADPTRMAAQIVSGIGFLGAGAIIQSRGGVSGMTTAAMIWLVAAIGFTIGAGYPLTALFFTFTTLGVLRLINPVYQLLENEKDYDYFQVEILSLGSVRKTVESIITNEDLQIDEIIEEKFSEKKGQRLLTLYMLAHKRHIQRIARDFEVSLKVLKVAYYSVGEQASKETKEQEPLKLSST